MIENSIGNELADVDGKGNRVPQEVWVTHWDTDSYGTYLLSVSDKSWESDYDAPVTTYASNTRYVPAAVVHPAEKHKVTIRWGKFPEPDDKPETFEFETAAELAAFMHGVEAMSGWMEYEIVDE